MIPKNDRNYLDSHYVKLSLRDALALDRVLSHEYISYEELEGRQAYARLTKFIEKKQKERENELAIRTSESAQRTGEP